jgi:hypothetical protein
MSKIDGTIWVVPLPKSVDAVMQHVEPIEYIWRIENQGNYDLVVVVAQMEIGFSHMKILLCSGQLLLNCSLPFKQTKQMVSRNNDWVCDVTTNSLSLLIASNHILRSDHDLLILGFLTIDHDRHALMQPKIDDAWSSISKSLDRAFSNQIWKWYICWYRILMVLLKIPDFKSVSKRQLASLLNVSGSLVLIYI